MEHSISFDNTDFGKLDIIIINGKEYFPATQCAKILGYANPYDAITKHCKVDGVVKREGVSYTTNQHGVTTEQMVEIKYISEGNLYRLIVSSKLPAAEQFEKWIFDEVLPSLRSNGYYSVNTSHSDLDALKKRIDSMERCLLEYRVKQIENEFYKLINTQALTPELKAELREVIQRYCEN